MSLRRDGSESSAREASGSGKNEGADEAPWSVLERAVSEGRVRAVAWDHSAVGVCLVYPVTRLKWVVVGLGTGGVHRFPVLTELAQWLPIEVRSVLLAVVRGESRRSLLSRLAHAPRVYLGKSYAALRLALSDSDRRRLLLCFLRDATVRKRVGLDQLLEDLLKLSLLQRARAGKLLDLPTVRIEVSLDAHHSVLLYRSVDGASVGTPGTTVGKAADPSAAEVTLKKILWDHSAIANSVLCPALISRQLTISLGPDGVYEFRALAELARRYPGETWRALFPDVSTDLLVSSI